MTPRLPAAADFPSSLVLSITPPPSAKQPLNIIILLHGLGDTNVPFARLGTQLNLPYTACLSIRASSPVPALFTGSDAPSFHWGDDIVFDQSNGSLDLDSGFDKSLKILREDVKDVLIRKCGFLERDLLFFGFGQGAMPALLLVREDPTVEYGGVVSIGGRLPSSSKTNSKGRTPILLLGGSRSQQVTRTAVETIKESFTDVEYIKWQKSEDTMPGNREEMTPIMSFFARRLRSRAGVPEGAVEVGRP